MLVGILGTPVSHLAPKFLGRREERIFKKLNNHDYCFVTRAHDSTSILGSHKFHGMRSERHCNRVVPRFMTTAVDCARYAYDGVVRSCITGYATVKHVDGRLRIRALKYK